MDFRVFFKNIGGAIRSKKYLGILGAELPTNAKRWDGSDFLSCLDVSLYTNRALAKRADKMSEIEFLLKDAKGNVIDRDPLLDLLYKPNKVFTGRQFWALYQKYYDAVGEVYIMIERNREIFQSSKVVGLHLLIPTLVTPKFNADGTPLEYEYRAGDKTITYPADQIIYIHNPDPKQPLRGQSLLRSGINAIQTETQISTYHSRILENGGKVEGVFKFQTGPLTENQLSEIKAKYKKEYAEAKNAGMPLFLGGNADYIKTGLSPEELSFLEAKRMTLEDICILTGVPKSMLASTNDAKFDNADADRAIFLREVMKGQYTILTTALDERLFPDNQVLTFVDPTPENIEQKLKEVESGLKNSYMTINEARARTGLDPVDNGDEILVPFNLAPLGSSAQPAAKAKTKDAGDHPLRDPEIRRMYWGIQMKRLDNREKLFDRNLKEYFDDQEKRLIEMLDPSKTRVFRKKNIFDDLLKLELEVKIGKEKFLPVLTELLKQAGVDAMELVGTAGAFNLTSDIVSWLDGRTNVFLNQINETTFKKLRDDFTESLDAGEGRESLISRIQDTYGGIKKSRAALIARTEVHNATQFGTMQGYKQAGLGTKIWVAVLDSATRDSHAATDGEERPIDRPFSNGLMFPGDPNGSAEEVINCRCVI